MRGLEWKAIRLPPSVRCNLSVRGVRCPQLFLAMARAHARDPNAKPVFSGYSRNKTGFIVPLVNDFTTGKLSGRKIEAASDREAAKILLDVKGFGVWCVGEVSRRFLVGRM